MLFHTAGMRLFFLMLMIVVCDGDAFDDAMVSTTVLQHKHCCNKLSFVMTQESVFIISDPHHRNISRHAVMNLMLQQDIIPSQLRLLSDVGLLRMAQLAAVGGVSRWKRENGTRFFLNKDGVLLHAYSPGAVESDVMLCIICVLLTFIAMMSAKIKHADVF
jgi:hypothetical protein